MGVWPYPLPLACCSWRILSWALSSALAASSKSSRPRLWVFFQASPSLPTVQPKVDSSCHVAPYVLRNAVMEFKVWNHSVEALQSQQGEKVVARITAEELLSGFDGLDAVPPDSDQPR